MLFLSLLLAVTPVAAPPRSEVLSVPRPAGGEYLGLYLMGKKVGYVFTDVSLSADGKTVTAVTDTRFKAQVGQRISERRMLDRRTFESGPKGKLLSLHIEQAGDGGDQTLDGTVTAKGLVVVRRRPGRADETLVLPPPKETVEDADQARVALGRGKVVESQLVDALDLQMYRVTSTPGPAEKRTVGGVPVTVRQVTTLSEKEKVPSDAFIDDKGRVLEIRFGPTMRAQAEPPEVAKRMDLVEVFGLTRVVLPNALPAARQVPGTVTMVMSGLPEKFRRPTYRQQFDALADGKVKVTITAAPPRKTAPLPLADPAGGANLKSDIVVEASDAAILAKAREVLGAEKDAYQAARRISRWVGQAVVNDYGASSDRATDVLKSLKGDCTEHSLLTVALLRAVGIPAKRVDGVVYLRNEDGVPALYWHEWVEAFVGEWTQLDPTFEQDVADAGHFAVGEESNAEIVPLIGALTVHQASDKAGR